VTAKPATPKPTDPPRHSRLRPTGPPNPFEVFLLAICAVQGWAVLTHIAEPTSLQALLPPWLRVMWGLLLLAGGVLSVSGLYWFDQFTGVEIKRVGLLCAAGGTLAYGAALLTIGPTGFVVAATNIAFALACIVRVVQVTRALKAARGRITAMRPPRRTDGEPR
jgi:hypothetical protein